jgi:hypothetical protein
LLSYHFVRILFSKYKFVKWFNFVEGIKMYTIYMWIVVWTVQFIKIYKN